SWHSGAAAVSSAEGCPNCLSTCLKQFFNCIHDKCLRIAKTEVSHLFRLREESLRIERRITTFAVVIAAQPDRDVLRICNLVAGVLLTCDLCNIPRDLCPSRRNDCEGKDQSNCNGRELDHQFLLRGLAACDVSPLAHEIQSSLDSSPGVTCLQ